MVGGLIHTQALGSQLTIEFLGSVKLRDECDDCLFEGRWMLHTHFVHSIYFGAARWVQLYNFKRGLVSSGLHIIVIIYHYCCIHVKRKTHLKQLLNYLFANCYCFPFPKQPPQNLTVSDYPKQTKIMSFEVKKKCVFTILALMLCIGNGCNLYTLKYLIGFKI